jgi:hypothetical protein
MLLPHREVKMDERASILSSVLKLHDPRRNACPCFLAGAASWSAAPVVSTQAQRAVDREAERSMERVFLAAPTDRHQHVLNYIDLRMGELRA